MSEVLSPKFSVPSCLFLRRPPWLAQEHERTEFAAGGDVVDPVLVEISDGDLRTGPRGVVYEFRNELRAPSGALVANRLVDVKHRRAERIRIRIAFLMREEPLADNEIRNAVAIHVRARGSVRLRE